MEEGLKPNGVVEAVDASACDDGEDSDNNNDNREDVADREDKDIPEPSHRLLRGP